MKVVTLMLAVVLLITWNIKRNCWRGLTPLHSNCDDVKRALSVEKCSTPMSFYTLPDFRVMIEFVNETCYKNPNAWRVSPDTVTAITLSPTKPIRPSDLGLDLSNYEVRDDEEIVGVVHYVSREEGVTAFLYNGFVETIYLYPRANEENLRCKPLKSP